jgi:hypothetical protein
MPVNFSPLLVVIVAVGPRQAEVEQIRKHSLLSKQAKQGEKKKKNLQ